jgi:hypothetical protein
MLDFDKINDWEPSFTAAFAPHLPSTFRAELRAADPELIEDGRDCQSG